MDLTIPSHLPLGAQKKLQELIYDYNEENLTPKGYINKRAALLDSYKYNDNSALLKTPTSQTFFNDQQMQRSSIDSNRSAMNNASLQSASSYPTDDILSNTNNTQGQKVVSQTDTNSLHTTVTSNSSLNQSIFPSNSNNNTVNNADSISGSSFNPYKQTYDRYNTSTPGNSSSFLAKSSTPMKSIRSSINRHHRRKSSQISLAFDPTSSQYNPMAPILPRVSKLTSTFKGASLSSILHSRAVSYSKDSAIISISDKGKEKNISWSKLHGKAEKIGNELTKDKKNIHKMDKILLWYDQNDIIEFAVALFGCFYADMIAVPVSFETYSLNEITEIIKLTNCKNILISDECFRSLDNLSTNNGKLKLIKSEFFAKINFIKTNDFGTSSKSKNINNIPNISYIEFTRTPLGKLSGVVMKYKILENQLEAFAQVLNSRNPAQEAIRPLKPSYKPNAKNKRYTVISTLDSTRNTGLIFGLLFNIYSGNLVININSKYLSSTSGVLESIVDKYRANILLCDQLQLKQVVINYLDNPLLVQKKSKTKIDLKCVKFCITTCTTIDTDVSDMIVQKWLNNLGCMDASQCYSPMLTLPDIGGCFVSIRDHLKHDIKRVDTITGVLKKDTTNDDEDEDYDREFSGNTETTRFKGNFHADICVEKEHLKENIVKVSKHPMINTSTSAQKYIKLSAFGLPLVDSHLVVVNPDDGTLVQDETVGEIWISSPSITNEFYHTDKVNDFVFKAHLNYNKMFRMLERSNAIPQAFNKLKATMRVCLPETNFLRTKLIGFIYKNKIYVLSLVEDMILQNKLIRLDNGLHTSDLSLSIEEASETSGSTSESTIKKRVVQTHYLQHITENLVRTAEHVQEVSAFELQQYPSEHFLIICVESDLVTSRSQVTATKDKPLNEFVDKIYKLLWIFHRIQPICIMVLPPGSLPRRYCSLEIANSTVVKKYLTAQLNVKFLKFQLDNVILDFIPRISFERESIFSDHLSKLRHLSIEDTIVNQGHNPNNLHQFYQINQNIIEKISIDSRTQMDLNSFESIMALLEFRCNNQGNDLAFNDGYATASPNSTNNYHKAITWNNFNNMVASYLKKILESKTPLKNGDSVIVISDNSVEYVATVLACFYCGFKIIPLPTIDQISDPEAKVSFFFNIVSAYKVKRVFCDYKNHFHLDDSNSATGKLFKKLKHRLPKITIFSKIKVKPQFSISFMKKQIRAKLGNKYQSSVIFIDPNDDMDLKLTTIFKGKTLLELCKHYKEILQLSSDHRLVSACSHPTAIDFVKSCFLGIYVGTTTTLYSVSDITNNPKEFFMDLKNLTIKDLFLTENLLRFILLNSKENILRNVPNVLLPITGRPNHDSVLKLISRYPQAGCTIHNLNYIYGNKFNPFISIRSYPSISIFLDCESLRVGVIKEVDPNTEPNFIELNDCGIPVCEELRIVNAENKDYTYSNELGEVLVFSKNNVNDYSFVGKSGKLVKESFFSAQLSTEIDGKKFVRTGDLGFLKPFLINNKPVNVLFILSELNNTIESSGFHCVVDIEKTIENVNVNIVKCLVAKMGGYTIALVKLRDKNSMMGNLVPLIVNSVLQKHKLVINLVCFVDNIHESRALTIDDFIKNNKNYIYGVYQSL